MQLMSLTEFADDHKDGTYVEYKLSEKSAAEIKNFCTDAGIDPIVKTESLHCTILYSRKPAPAAKFHHYPLIVNAYPKHWTIFNMRDGKKCLVLELESGGYFETIHHDLMSLYDASHDFPEYKAHMTVSYDYQGEVPTQIPQFILEFDRPHVESLDPLFVPKNEE